MQDIGILDPITILYQNNIPLERYGKNLTNIKNPDTLGKALNKLNNHRLLDDANLQAILKRQFTNEVQFYS